MSRFRMEAAAALALLLLGASPSLLAGQRKTVWAYPPGAGPKGSVELESWVTTSRHERGGGTAVEYRVEIENGLTDDVSLDVYLGVVKQAPGESAKLDRVQASLRANLLPLRLRRAIDLTGYFELKRDLDFGNPWEFEAILIGGHSYGKLWYDFNLVYESELSSNAFARDARELKAIVGAGYEISPRFSLGGELLAVNEHGERSYSVGPTVSISLTDKTWIALGPQFGLNGEADRLKVRALFGIFF